MSACFHLCPVVASEGNPFERYPQLQRLWSPELARLASEAIDEAFEQRTQGIDVGEIFLVANPQDSTDVWGITGFLPWPDGAGVLARVGLRWHGLIAKHREQGLSMAVLEDVRARAHARYPTASHFVEFMPDTPEHATTAGYFERAGFVRWGEPERVEWSSVPWQEYVCDIRTPVLLPAFAPSPTNG